MHISLIIELPNSPKPYLYEKKEIDCSITRSESLDTSFHSKIQQRQTTLKRSYQAILSDCTIRRNHYSMTVGYSLLSTHEISCRIKHMQSYETSLNKFNTKIHQIYFLIIIKLH